MILKSVTEYNGEFLKTFSCGNKSLDRFFNFYSQNNDIMGYGKTFVLENNGEIIGFFTLCSAQIQFQSYPSTDKNALPKYPIPCIRIARLAVSKTHQGKGYGKLLLKEAFLKIIDASKTVGIFLVIVDAKESSANFYIHYGFEKLIEGSLTFFLNLETIKKAIK